MSQIQPDTPIALVVEGDEATRHLAGALIEETELEVIECASAEAALSVLERPDVHVALVFADARLSGAMDGVALARTVERRWPSVRMVVSANDRSENLPRRAVQLPKPWRALDLLVQAERATIEAHAA